MTRNEGGKPNLTLEGGDNARHDAFDISAQSLAEQRSRDHEAGCVSAPEKRSTMIRDFADSTEDVLRRAFLSTPLEGDDLPQKLVREFFFTPHGQPNDHGVELLLRYNRYVSAVNERDLNFARAKDAARILDRPELTRDIYSLLVQPRREK